MAVSCSGSVHDTEVDDPEVQPCILLACINIHTCILLYITDPVVITSFARALQNREQKGLTPLRTHREWNGCLPAQSGTGETNVYTKFTSRAAILGCSRGREECRLAKLGKALCDCNTCHMAYSADEEKLEASLRRYVTFTMETGAKAVANFACQMGDKVFKGFTEIEGYVL